jgi:putative transposase
LQGGGRAGRGLPAILPGEKGYPRFKCKKHPKQSYTSKRNGRDGSSATIRIEGNRIRLPKVVRVKFARSREVQGHILSATVRLAPSGKFYVSVLVDMEIQPLKQLIAAVGIDLGLLDFAVLSTGETIQNPRHLGKHEEGLKRWQMDPFPPEAGREEPREGPAKSGQDS